MDKKKLLALAIFLIMGFFMITFANPSDQLTPVDNSASNPVADNTNANQTTPTDNAQNRPTTPVANAGTTTNTPIVTPVVDANTDTQITNDDENDEPKVNIYTVNFVDHEGKTLKSQVVAEHQDATASDIKVLDYTVANMTYTFAKWDKDFTDVTSNLTVKALYNVKSIIAVVVIDGKKTDKTVEVYVNEDTENKKDVKLTNDNINEYINVDQLPEENAGENNIVEKLTYDKKDGYVIEVETEKIPYKVTTDKWTSAKVNGKEVSEVYYGEEVVLSYKDREGYTFVEYVVEDGNHVYTTTNNTIVVTTNDIYVYSRYTINTYKIDYILNGGIVDGINPTEYTVESDDIKLLPAHKEGYDFIEWRDQDRKIRNVITKGSTGDLQLKAKFQARTDINYTVKILEEDLNGNYIEVKSTTYNDGTADKYTKINAPVGRYGFELNDSKTKRVMVLADGTTTVEFKYARKEYKVTFKYINDQAKPTSIVKNVKYEGSVESPDLTGLTYNKNGITYVFDKFEKDATNVTKDITIKALYNITNIKARVALLENKKITPIEGSATLKNVNPVIYAIKKNKYDELHKDYIASIEYTKDSDYDYKEVYIVYTPNDGFTVIVTRSLKKYTVTAQNGAHVNGSKAITDVAGKQVKLTHDNKIGYKFTNYLVEYADGTKKVITANTYTIEKQNVTIYAVYKINTYTVTFVYYDAAKGKTSTKETAEFGKGVTAPKVDDVVEYNGYNYKFKKWDKAFNYITKDIKVTALYDVNPITYTITYELDGGNFNTNAKYSYTFKEEYKLPTPTKEGFDFIGWTGSNGEKPEINVTIPKGSTGNKTYTANWTVKKFTVKWSVDGKIVETDTDVTYGSKPQYNGATPSKNPVTDESGYTYNYTFTGWKNLTDNTTITSDKTFVAELVTLKAEIIDGKQLSYTLNDNTKNIKNDIIVTVIDENNKTVKTLTNSEYTTNFDNTKLTYDNNKNLTISYSYKNSNLTNNKLFYEIRRKAFNTKFEVISVGNTYQASNNNCYEFDCSENTTTVSLDNKVLEVIEHYNQYIDVNKVTANYKTTGNEELYIPRRNDGKPQEVRWTEVKDDAIYDPVYIAHSANYDYRNTFVRDASNTTVKHGEKYPDNSYVEHWNGLKENMTGKTCNKKIFGIKANCSYDYKYVARTTQTNNLYRIKDEKFVEYKPVRYDINMDDINTVTIEYYNHGNEKENVKAGNFVVVFEYDRVLNKFVCIDEHEVK